ncbi:MAG: endonuclease domain-containing protein [Bacteroidia bacterium]
MGNILHNRKYLKTKRQNLRNNLEYSEMRLWTALNGKQVYGRKFRRQHSIGNFIVDFYCPAERLVIEVDGFSYSDIGTILADEMRDKKLAELEIRVLRFNSEEIKNIDFVLAEIAANFKSPIQPI